ncbi:MAG: hypothetical protein NVSMB68_02800 [Thermoanaerobaculia bacterium]
MNRPFHTVMILVGVLSMAQASGPAAPRARRARAHGGDFIGTPRDWAQFNDDERHSGSNRGEAGIDPESVSALQLIFQRRLPAVSDGAPALFSNNSRRRADHLLFFTATNGALIVTNGEGDMRWQSVPPAGPRWTTSSPVLDPEREYVYSYALDGHVHKYAMSTGDEVVNARWPVLVTRKPAFEKVSSALSIVSARNGSSILYATVAGYPDPGDAGDYQGHVVAIRLGDGSSTAFNALCSQKTTILGAGDCASRRAGIWGRSGVVYNEGDESLYVVTSNGPYNANRGGFNWGDSILRLGADLQAAKGKPLDSYTPDEFETLDKADLDLGSSALALAPRPGQEAFTLGIHAGKDGVIRVVDLQNLSGHGGPGHVGGELLRLNLPQGGYQFGAPAVWIDDQGSAWLYFANDLGIAALQLIGSAEKRELVERWRNDSVASDSSPVVANGVVFVARSGRITALDARSGKELWSDTHIGAIHWQSPIVVNGAVYISDLNGMLTGYALPKDLSLRR